MTQRQATATMSGQAIDARQLVGRYQIIDRLGSGGMATVYLARMEGPAGTGKLVAIKRIHPHLASEERFVHMFLDEWRIAAQIAHPNVCSVLDFGQTGDTYFLAMEYVMGETMLSFLASVHERPEILDSETWRSFVAYSLAEAAEGLHAAHELRDEHGCCLNVVHRDVSPDNIFVTFDGGVKVSDFGVARARGQLHQTRSGTIKGKYGYMAPEILYGDNDFDRRVDLWALGVCAWELLAGDRLFRREAEAATISAIVNDPIPRLIERRPAMPRELDDVVMSTLSRDPAGRPASARELGIALRNYVVEHGERMDTPRLAEIARAMHPSALRAKEELRRQARRSGSMPSQAADPGDRSTTTLETPGLVMRAAKSPGEGRMAALDIATLTSPPPGADNECLADHAAMSPATRRAAFRRRRVRFLGVMAVMLLAAAGLGGLLALNLNKRDAPLPQAETLALLASDPAADPVSADGPAVATRAGQAAPAVTATVEKTLRKEGTPERPDDNSGETAPPASDARVATRPVVEEGQPSRKPPRTRSTPRGEDAPDRTAPRTGAAGDTTTAAGGGTTEGTAKSTTSSVIPADQRMTTVTSRDKPGVTGLDRAVPSLTTPGGDSGQKKPPAGVDSAQKKPPASKLFARAAIESLSAKGSLSRAQVREAVDRSKSAYEDCYHDAAVRAGGGQAVKLAVTLDIDESGWARNVSVGTSQLSGLSACVKKTAQKLRSRFTPDIGSVRVTFQLAFQPTSK